MSAAKFLAAIACVCILSSCGTTERGYPAPDYSGAYRSFESSFESVDDFEGFYIVPHGDYDSGHELSNERSTSGSLSHKSWIARARDEDNDSSPTYLPHRAYPTVQFQKTPGGIYRTPCLVSIRAWLDMEFQDKPSGRVDDWFSFATLSPDPSDDWARTLGANLGPDGYLRLMHVPGQGEQDYLYQAGPADDPEGGLKYPQRTWVRIDLYVDFDAEAGCAKLWQDGKLVSSAKVEGGSGGLAQAHFGLYASAALAAGSVYNDDLRIVELADEAAAMKLLQAEWGR